MPSAGRRLDARAGHDQEAVLGVVGVVGAGVVLERVDALVAADRADRAPREVAEVDDEVGRDAVDLLVESSGLKTACRAGRRLVRDRREPLGQLVAHALVVLRRDDALAARGPSTLRKTRA